MDPDLRGETPDVMAIRRLKEFERAALEKHHDGYWLAFSGGKDSVVILDLAERSGVKFSAYHALTTVDPPELVRFVRTFPQVVRLKPARSMARLIREHGQPPRRQARYCCEDLKEVGGDGRVVVTGIRWQESNRRSKRRMLESCYRRPQSGRLFLNIIIDWTTAEVWEYIRERKLRYCSLYDEGWKRIGCVLCPMIRDVDRQMRRWPAIAKIWERAIKDTWKPGPRKSSFRSPEEYWQWWLDRDAPARINDDDPVLFEDDPDLAR